jgi:Asp-tRNA(Asn)/Glu-tRNA(Gln) amidotransferase A subunit family amidase
MIWALLPVLFVIGVVRFWFGRRPIFPDAQVKPSIGEVLDQPDKIRYEVRAFHAPKVTGLKFKVLIWLSYTRFGHYLIRPSIIKSSNMDCMKKYMIPEKATYFPCTPGPSLQDHTHPNAQLLDGLVEKEVTKQVCDGFYRPTVSDYVRAFRSGEVTPADVATAVLAAIGDSDRANPPLRAVVQSDRAVVLAMASASTQRWKDGKTLSLLDGVPVAIKEEFHCEPYMHCSGASYMPIMSKGVPESTIAQKLKRAGAIIIGMTNMQEYGTGTLGSNPHPPHLTARNPYDPHCYTGGSSSGSAASVAAGFCPVAIGTDGGGSIRIPAALCGTVGLKPTFGVVDTQGTLRNTFTVGASGPLTSSVLDTAITMSIIAQERDGDKTSISLQGIGEKRLDGLKVGIYWDHFSHASEEVVQKCKAALSHLQELGAELVDIKIPEMEDCRIAHVVSIGAEFASCLGLDLDRHFSDINLETHLLVGSSSSYSAIEYINAQKQRTRAIEVLKAIFGQVDVIVTPGTACTAPRILPDAVPLGVLDGESSAKLMRFAFLGNLTGIPGLVLPVGYSASGLPISMQLMGRWYQENLLLKVGWALEQTGAFPAKKPKVFYKVL